MKWEKIEYPWKGVNIPDSEIDSRMKLFDDFVTYFGFDRMAWVRVSAVMSGFFMAGTAITTWRIAVIIRMDGRRRRTCQSMTTAYSLRNPAQAR